MDAVEQLGSERPISLPFLCDGNLEIRDPYGTLVLDPWEDQYISAATYPDMPSYPTGQANWQQTVFQTMEPEFAWTDQNFQRPPSDRLIIYETLVRDFDETQTFQDVIDRLDYIQYMGFNAIELMPVSSLKAT